MCENSNLGLQHLCDLKKKKIFSVFQSNVVLQSFSAFPRNSAGEQKSRSIDYHRGLVISFGGPNIRPEILFTAGSELREFQHPGILKTVIVVIYCCKYSLNVCIQPLSRVGKDSSELSRRLPILFMIRLLKGSCKKRKSQR